MSHFATYAVTEDVAVMSGMITDPACRGQGLGGRLVKALSGHVRAKGKTPVLYCYEEAYNTWYQKLGYTVIGTAAKLERRKT